MTTNNLPSLSIIAADAYADELTSRDAIADFIAESNTTTLTDALALDMRDMITNGDIDELIDDADDDTADFIIDNMPTFAMMTAHRILSRI